VPVLRISRCCSFIQNFPCGQINNSLCQCLPSDVPRKPGVTWSKYWGSARKLHRNVKNNDNPEIIVLNFA
jgi:hypothetical protein